ncbi:hypothetical protein M3699_05150 [Peribacillus simplex]|uniref:hypothetical protein n=1 Tax=Peribacillus simplex TaxID=1478 RepID=UPI0020409D3F|nr:hypothetical protein [Peribacillus simplex]MCM3673276.1 hypothetical protein [Peribacillus simplex]
MGIVFLRIVDSEGKSKTLDDYALAYVGVAMVDIVIVSLAPVLMMTGQHWLFTLVTVVAGSAILLFIKSRGMWVKPGIRQQRGGKEI